MSRPVTRRTGPQETAAARRKAVETQRQLRPGASQFVPWETEKSFTWSGATGTSDGWKPRHNTYLQAVMTTFSGTITAAPEFNVLVNGVQVGSDITAEGVVSLSATFLQADVDEVTISCVSAGAGITSGHFELRCGASA